MGREGADTQVGVLAFSDSTASLAPTAADASLRPDLCFLT